MTLPRRTPDRCRLLRLLPRAQAATATRTGAFEYGSVRGLLIKEIKEPDNFPYCLAIRCTRDGTDGVLMETRTVMPWRHHAT